MADIINLRRARKAKARDMAQATADINRARFGRTKAERVANTLEIARNAHDLDGAKRER